MKTLWLHSDVTTSCGLFSAVCLNCGCYDIQIQAIQLTAVSSRVPGQDFAFGFSIYYDDS